MKSKIQYPDSRNSVAENNTLIDSLAPKWAVVIDDQLFPMPRRNLTARTILHQAGYTTGVHLVRDHSSPNDVLFNDDALVNLGEGNVFRIQSGCSSTPKRSCSGPAKLAFVCDDAWEVTLISRQTGRSLKRLLGLPDDAVLFRDLEARYDSPIIDTEAMEFVDGPVFTCRSALGSTEIKIIINGREKVVVSTSISFADLVVLAFGSIDAETIYTATYKYGQHSKPEGSMVQGDVVKIQCGMIFNVTPTRKS